MTKKALGEIVTKIVNATKVAHNCDEDAARTLVGLALNRNVDLIVESTSPPEAAEQPAPLAVVVPPVVSLPLAS